MTTKKEDPRISAVLDFWFGLSPMSWFRGGESLDDEIREKFGPLVVEARSGALQSSSSSPAESSEDGWTATPRGTLALLILLDQFPRNLYRGSADSFTSDPQAADVAVRAIARGFDREIEAEVEAPAAGGDFGDGRTHMRSFFYLPLMHAEDLTAQVACVALAESRMREYPEGSPQREGAAKSWEAAKGHLDCLARFGRFPKRNEALGRETTEEERKYIEESPGSW